MFHSSFCLAPSFLLLTWRYDPSLLAPSPSFFLIPLVLPWSPLLFSFPPYALKCVSFLATLTVLIFFRTAKDPLFERIPTDSTYADDELVKLVTQHRCYIVATCDRDLKRRLRKIPGVPIMSIVNHKYTIERMPEAWGAPK